MHNIQKKVLLINPAVNPSSQNRIINKIINTTFPTSLGSLAAFLISKNFNSISIIDEQLHYIEEKDLPLIVSSMAEPRIIGLSILTINAKRGYWLAQRIKQIDPRATLVFGGIHPTVLPDETLLKGADIVVRGEGEETFLALLEAITKKNDYREIAGISFKDSGRIIHNPERPLISDLDTLPNFPYHFFAADRNRYPSFGSIMTSRGCPYGCIFCSSRSVSGRRYRYFSIERIISEIELLVDRYSQKTIWMMDDNIAENRIHFLGLLDAIIAKNFPPEVSFHGSMRGDNINDEMLEKARQANFRMISFGLETGSESLMRIVNKGESVKQITDAIKKTNQKGISVATTIIFGLPGETRKDRQHTIQLVNSLPLASVRFNTLTPYPGTPVFEMLRKTGEIDIKGEWENFAVQYIWEGDDLPYVPTGNSTYELIFDTMFANLSFYLRFSSLRNAFRSSFAGGNVIRIPENWCASWRLAINFVLAAFYLGLRLLSILLRLILHLKRVDKFTESSPVKDSLESAIGLIEGASYTFNACKYFYLVYVEKILENVLYERYFEVHKPVFAYLPFNYQILPKSIRYALSKYRLSKRISNNTIRSLTYDESWEELRDMYLSRVGLLEGLRFKKTSWPQDKRYCLILTHDVEDSDNWRWVREIAKAEMDSGLRSSWNIVPCLYRIDYRTLDWLVENGFEIGLHGYNHDYKIAFLKEDKIRSRFDSCRDFIKRYEVRGFRSPSWLRSERLFKVLQDYFLYDTSVPDIDYISLGRGGKGCYTIFPYRIDKLVELPTTIPYEAPLQQDIDKNNLNVYWHNKIQWIKGKGGLVNIITHPDRYYSGCKEMVGIYKNLLEVFKQDAECMCMLAYEAAEYYQKFNQELTT